MECTVGASAIGCANVAVYLSIYKQGCVSVIINAKSHTVWTLKLPASCYESNIDHQPYLLLAYSKYVNSNLELCIFLIKYGSYVLSPVHVSKKISITI